MEQQRDKKGKPIPARDRSWTANMSPKNELFADQFKVGPLGRKKSGVQGHEASKKKKGHPGKWLCWHKSVDVPPLLERGREREREGEIYIYIYIYIERERERERERV